MNQVFFFSSPKKGFFFWWLVPLSHTLGLKSSNVSEIGLRISSLSAVLFQTPGYFISCCSQSHLHFTFADLKLSFKSGYLLFLSLQAFLTLISISIKSTSPSSQFYTMQHLHILSGFMYISLLSPSKFFDGSDLSLQSKKPSHPILCQIHLSVNTYTFSRRFSYLCPLISRSL